MNSTNFANSRLGFEVAMNVLTDMGFNIKDARPTQSYLRSEMAIVNTSAQYSVPILVNDGVNGNAFPTEQRLKLQDVFVPLEVGVFVGVASSATGPLLSLCTYGNTTLFPAGAAAALNALWSGKMSLINNNIQVLPAWDLLRHLIVPRTQQAANTGYTASGVNLQDSLDFSQDAFFPIAPSFVLSGGANLNFTLNLPTAITTVTANSRIAVIFRGILLQNVTNVN
jgi:hypothetical protein